MASRSGRRGVYVRPSERASFLRRLEDESPSSDASAASSVASIPKTRRSAEKPDAKQAVLQAGGLALLKTNDDEGCRACGKDDDHVNLMICEGCSAEFHYYCLDPPLRSVPTEEWYCDKCKPQIPDSDDGLERLVLALPPRFTSRFGEIVWAQGGTGFGWWPACIYDPRLTIGGARETARKNLGKKHLVYFFECHSAPFSALPDSKIMEWDSGLAEDCHIGKSAQAAGKVRLEQFRAAFQVAIVENGKPIELRMDWNHPAIEEQHLPSPSKPKKRRQPQESDERGKGSKRERGRRNGDQSPVRTSCFNARTVPASRPNLVHAVQVQASPPSSSFGVGQSSYLFCKIFRRVGDQDLNVGFIRLGDRGRATFAAARVVIQRELDPESLPSGGWNFYVPSLELVSRRQENSLGPMLSFLRGTCAEDLGNGTAQHPLKLTVVETRVQDIAEARKASQLEVYEAM